MAIKTQTSDFPRNGIKYNALPFPETKIATDEKRKIRNRGLACNFTLSRLLKPFCTVQIGSCQMERWRACRGCANQWWASATAFDAVPHQRLLMELEHYAITENSGIWLRSWLTKRTQTVLLKGMASNPVRVCGVPQGTVLGPLNVFALHKWHSKWYLKVFKGSSLCWWLWIVDGKEDEIKLQSDLEELTSWAGKWQMTFRH